MILEYDYLLLNDGTRYTLKDVISAEGFGMAQREINTQRGPYQHGESFVSRYLIPRSLQYVIRVNFHSRDAYNKGVNTLVDAVNKTVTLVRVFPDASKRYIDVYPDEGPNLDSPGGWNRWSIQDTIRFLAPDPTFYNPVQQSLGLSSVSGQLEFTTTGTETPAAITDGNRSGMEFRTINRETATYIDQRFYIGLEFYPIAAAGTVVNNGTWETYPLITIRGPIEDPEIHNVTTGDVIKLSPVTLTYDQMILIDLKYGGKSVYYRDGTDAIALVTDDSDLGTFKLMPGSNYISVSGTGGGPPIVALLWYERYLSVGER